MGPGKGRRLEPWRCLSCHRRPQSGKPTMAAPPSSPVDRRPAQVDLRPGRRQPWTGQAQAPGPADSPVWWTSRPVAAGCRYHRMLPLPVGEDPVVERTAWLHVTVVVRLSRRSHLVLRVQPVPPLQGQWKRRCRCSRSLVGPSLPSCMLITKFGFGNFSSGSKSVATGRASAFPRERCRNIGFVRSSSSSVALDAGISWCPGRQARVAFQP